MEGKNCKKCGKWFANSDIMDGKKIYLHSRIYCLGCSPRGTNHIKPSQLLNDHLTDIQQEILTGHLLGDGNLEIGGTNINAGFRVERMFSDWEYLLWTYDNFKDFVSNNGIKINQRYLKKMNKIYSSICMRTRISTEFSLYRSLWYG